jgi:ribose transport system permease protein
VKRKQWPELAPALAVGFGLGLFVLLDRSMGQPANLVRILTQTLYLGLPAYAMVFLLMMGQIDLSTGAVAGLSAALVGNLIIVQGVAEPWALGLALVAASAFGLLNGWLVLGVGVPAFFATLSTSFVALGLMGLLLKSGLGVVNVTGQSPLLTSFSTSGPWSGIPWSFLLFGGLLVGGDLALRRTVLGPRLAAIGGNLRAAQSCGIHITLWRTLGFMGVSLASALAGLCVLGIGGGTDRNLGDGWALWIIAIAVLGGASLKGGVGSVLGCFLGALLIQVIRSGLGAAHIQTNSQGIVVGLILLGAASLDVARQRQRG